MIKTEDFQIKDLKTSPLELSLHFCGKLVATVSNEGFGHRWQWLDKEAKQSFYQHVKTLAFGFGSDSEHGDRFLDGLIEFQAELDWEARHKAEYEAEYKAKRQAEWNAHYRQAWKAHCRQAEREAQRKTRLKTTFFSL